MNKRKVQEEGAEEREDNNRYEDVTMQANSNYTEFMQIQETMTLKKHT